MCSLPFSSDWLTQRFLLTANVMELCCKYGSVMQAADMRSGRWDGHGTWQDQDEDELLYRPIGGLLPLIQPCIECVCCHLIVPVTVAYVACVCLIC